MEQSPLLPHVRRSTRKIKEIWSDFKAFVDKGNVVDLAVGIVIGSAFSEVVTSFVADIFSPFLGLVVSSKLSETFMVIRDGEHGPPYKTRDEARQDGAITWNYGNFVQLMINFFLISMALFMVVRILQAFHRKQLQTEVVRECQFCFAHIDGRARKCSSCTADL